MSNHKKATAANVSRALGTKFSRSFTYRSMIRGLPNRSTGFKVEKRGPESAVVTHIMSGYAFSASAEGRRQEELRLAAYAEFLNEAGFDAKVLTSEFGYGNCVGVKTKED